MSERPKDINDRGRVRGGQDLAQYWQSVILRLNPAVNFSK